MLRIAVQSKGRLYDETMMLLEEAGIKLNGGKEFCWSQRRISRWKFYS